jgi:c-di-GMP-binding flagellar brake protein YcgR
VPERGHPDPVHASPATDHGAQTETESAEEPALEPAAEPAEEMALEPDIAPGSVPESVPESVSNRTMETEPEPEAEARGEFMSTALPVRNDGDETARAHDGTEEVSESLPPVTSSEDTRLLSASDINDFDFVELSTAELIIHAGDASGSPDDIPVLVPATHISGHHVEQNVSPPMTAADGVESRPVSAGSSSLEAMTDDGSSTLQRGGYHAEDIPSQGLSQAPDALDPEAPPVLEPLYDGDFIDEEDVLIDEEEAMDAELQTDRKENLLVADAEFDEVEFAEYMAGRRLRVLPGQRTSDRDLNDWTTWTLLLTVRAREVVFGPLQENLNVDIFTHGFRIHRSRLSKLINTEAPGEEEEETEAYTIPFGVLSCERDGNSIQLQWTSPTTQKAESLHLSGDGAIAITAALEAVGEELQVLSVASFARLTWLGFVPVNGVAFVGHDGVVFSPLGMVSTVMGRLRKFSADQFIRIELVEGTFEFTMAGKQKPSMWMDGSEVTLGALAAWWSGRLSRRVQNVSEPMPVVWYPDGDAAYLATANLIRGGLELEAIGDEDTQIRNAGVHLVFEAVSAMSVDAAPELQIRIRGVLHRIWFLEGPRPQMMLRDHVKRVAFTVWPEDWDPSSWKRCIGTFAAARLLLANEQEQVLYPVSCQDSTRGILLSAPIPAKATATLYRGARIEVELLTMRQGQVFRATITKIIKEEATEDESFEPKILVEVFPSSDEPMRRASRRSAHRVEVIERVRVALTMEHPQMPRMRGYLSDLSAGGCRVILDRGFYPEGTVGRVRIPMKRGAATFECEVLHDLKEAKGEGRASVGLRFIGLMEQGRSELQREVLWRERRNKKFAPGELKE